MFSRIHRHFILNVFLATWCICVLTGARGTARDDSLDEQITKTLAAKRADLIELRRDLHRHPEVSGLEKRTASVIAKRLRSIGLQVQTDVGGFGVVGVLRGGKPGPVVAYRADMDAVRTTAPDPVAFASETPGVRHICGHDVHTTVAVGIAEALAEVRDEFPGTVKFIFQPSEENAEGAKAMIDDGVLENPIPDAIFAVHCAPLEIGQMGSREGMLLPGLDVVGVTLSGQGDLEAAAKECATVILSVNSTEASSSEGSPGGFIASWVFQSEEQADGGWIVMGMVRASSPERHARAKASIEKGLGAIDSPGVSYDLDYTERAIPPVMNDPELTLRTNKVFKEVLGEDAVFAIDEPNPNFSEDFAHFQDRIPGAMFFLGVANEEKGIMGMPHSAMFSVDEDAITLGARAMALVLLDYLTNH